jgi:hypothetical protein
MPGAFVTRSARWAESMAQPTTRRDRAPMTTQQFTFLSRAGCSVMSVTHSWFGPSRWRSRWTRPVPVTSRLVRLPRERAGRRPWPALRISRPAVVMCPTVMQWP